MFFRNISFGVSWAQKRSFYKASVVCTNYTVFPYAALERKTNWSISTQVATKIINLVSIDVEEGFWKKTENGHPFWPRNFQNNEFYFIIKKRLWRLWSNLGQKYPLRLSTIWLKQHLSKYSSLNCISCIDRPH